MPQFAANNIEDLKTELESELNAPDAPRTLYYCTTANLPPAASFPFSQLFNTTLNITCVSNGVVWIRTDTGATV